MYINRNIKDLTAIQRAQLKYYLKKKDDPVYIKSQIESSAKYYNKNKENKDFLKKQSEKKKLYYQQQKEKLAFFSLNL